ncbi:MAG: hypothetical protein GX154_07470, partial [Clostridiales bacterium]|nr:hypothetical protein [Clostridiales bacterium]
MQLFIRNVVTPAVMVLGNYVSIFQSGTNDMTAKAVFLMAYEVLWCYAAVYICSKRPYEPFIRNRYQKLYKGKHLGKVLFVLSALCIALWFLQPAVRATYRTIIDIIGTGIKDNPYRHSDFLSTGSLARVASTLFVFLFSFLRIAVPGYIIVKLQSKKRSAFHLIISLVIISLQFFFISGAVAATLIAAGMLLLLVMDLYPKWRGLLLSVLIATSVLVTILVFSLNYHNVGSWYGIHSLQEYLSHWLNSYITGVDNVASIYQMPQENKLQIFIHTMIAPIPFRSTLLPGTTDWTTVNTLFTSLPRLSGQIVSTVGTGQFFFTEVFAPIF